MLKKLAALFLCSSCLASCQGIPVTQEADLVVVQQQQVPVVYAKPLVPISSDNKGLEAWWSFFGDSILGDLVSSAISMNAAELEKSETFPHDDVTLEKYEAYYKNPRVDLVVEVARNYVEYRYVQNQQVLLSHYVIEKNSLLNSTSGKDADVISKELDLLKVKNQEFEDQLSGFVKSMSKRTKLLPEYIEEVLRQVKPIPDYNMAPVLSSPVQVLADSSYIKAARTLLSYETKGQVETGQTVNVFPNLPISRIFGISDEVFLTEGYPRNVSIGQAKGSLDFGALEGVGAKERQEFKDNVISYVSEIEGLLITTSTLHEQQKVLEKAAGKAERMDVYKTRLASLRAEYEISKTVISLFDKLDLY